jgi:hypothetical protein
MTNPCARDVPLYGTEPVPHAIIFFVVFFVGFIASFLFIKKIDKSAKKERQKTISQYLLFLWVVGPPVWFFIEYFFYFPAYGNMADCAGFEKLKGAQDVSAKVWAAFTVVLGAMYRNRFPEDATKD